jgi:cytochrome P450
MSEQTVTPPPTLPVFPFPTPLSMDEDPELARLRVEQPVAKVRIPSGHEVWLITRYEDVKSVMSDQRFSRERTADPGAPSFVPSIQSKDMLVSMDPPAHSRVRRLVNKAFNYRAVERLRPRVVEIAAELLDGMAEQGPPADLVASLAKPLPNRVLCHALGVPPDEQHRLERYLEYSGSDSVVPPEQAAEVIPDAMAYLTELIDRKRRQPGEDLLTGMVEAHDEDGDRLTENELLMTTLLLFGAGQDTTRNQLSNSMVTLFRHPDQLELLIGKPELLTGAVQELVRFTMITQIGLTRVATTDVEVGGVTIRAGETVVPLSHSGNRDAAAFDHPDELDLARSDVGAQIGFGHGIHFCVGSALARLELQEALGALLARFPTLQPAIPLAELVWQPGTVIRTLTALPVTW